MNIGETYTDAYGIVFTGDVPGAAAGIADIHLIPKRLILDLGFSAVKKATLQSYSQRGMNTEKDDFRLIELDGTQYYGGRLTATFLDRRFELYGAWYQGVTRLESVRDNEGDVVVEAEGGSRDRNRNTLLGSRIDLTDDYADPRKGFRLDLSWNKNRPRALAPDFYTIDTNVTAYLPFGKRSTWAFNTLWSDAFVIRKGETDPATIQREQGIDCADPSLTADQRTFCIEVVNNSIAQNTFGAAASLGGFSRLRSYPQDRYQGAHTRFYGTEFRWNVTEEKTPFDLVFLKDIRTAVQISAFYEIGNTADRRDDLGDTWRSTYGVGARIVTASGVVFRADMAFGREGFAPEIFIGYPWEI